MKNDEPKKPQTSWSSWSSTSVEAFILRIVRNMLCKAFYLLRIYLYRLKPNCEKGSVQGGE